jgi:DNA-binding NarL/FixJ family response regulator
MYSSGDYFLIELSAILLPAVAILLFSVFVMLLFIRRYSRTLKRLYQMNFHGVELERKRIANDLHDQVGASLQQVKKALDVASHSLDKSNAINELNYAFEILQSESIDRVVCDLQIKTCKSLDIPKYCSRFNIPFLVFSSHLNHTIIRQLEILNMLGYVSKASSIDELKDGLLCLIENKNYYCSIVESEAFEIGKEEIPKLTITPAERRVLKAMKTGKPIEELAQMLRLSITTIQNHKARISDRNNCKINEVLIRYLFWEDNI